MKYSTSCRYGNKHTFAVKISTNLISVDLDAEKARKIRDGWIGSHRIGFHEKQAQAIAPFPDAGSAWIRTCVRNTTAGELYLMTDSMNRRVGIN